MDIDIAHYNNAQLVEALIAVNDEVYLDNALSIYKTLLRRKNWHYKDVDAAKLGFKNNWLLEWAHMFGIGGLLDEVYFENHQLDEKIQRLNGQLAIHEAKG